MIGSDYGSEYAPHAEVVASLRQSTLAAHGGNLAAIVARYGGAADDYLDVSANLNPLGPPPALVAALASAATDVTALARYPEPTYASLRAALARVHALDAEAIVVGNGAAALLEIALAVPRVRACVLPLPAFSEYRRALDALGIAVVPLRLDSRDDYALDVARVRAAVRASGADAILIANPHNPTGNALAKNALLELVESLAELGCRTIVDEAFVDYVPDASLVRDAAAHRSLVVVRSLTKLYAVPGLRVGFGVAAAARAAELRARLPSWPVTTLAAQALEAALADEAFAARSREANARERDTLVTGLRALGLRVVPPNANFAFAELPASAPNATALAAWLAREKRVVIRDCTSYDGLESGRCVRIAVRAGAENPRVIAAMRSALAAGAA